MEMSETCSQVHTCICLQVPQTVLYLALPKELTWRTQIVVWKAHVRKWCHRSFLKPVCGTIDVCKPFQNIHIEWKTQVCCLICMGVVIKSECNFTCGFLLTPIFKIPAYGPGSKNFNERGPCFVGTPSLLSSLSVKLTGQRAASPSPSICFRHLFYLVTIALWRGNASLLPLTV